MILRLRLLNPGVLACSVVLVACSNGRGTIEEPEQQGQEQPATFAVGGTVSGLAGSGLVLRNNGTDDLTIATDGRFAFAASVATDAAYHVTVAVQPDNPAQVCGIQNASGVMGGADVTNVLVSCTTTATPSFTIGGTVSGLEGSGLTLRNGGDTLAIASNGAFTFATPQPSGASYEVTVAAPPANPSQTCTLANASGTVGGADIRNVTVSCATDTFTIGGSVSGLLGDGLVLQNNGGDDVEVAADGAFVFPGRLATGAAYSITVSTQPANPTQACTLTNAAGVVGAANVANVAVSCTTSTFMIGGTVSGLEGEGLLLRNNGADDLKIENDGAFSFPTALSSGGTYSVTIATQPKNPVQECSLANAAGVVGGANVTNVGITCVTTQFRVGGSVSGLAGDGLVIQNNGADDFAIAANGPFTFPASLISGSPYSVTVLTQPTTPTQTCVTQNASGSVTDADIDSVVVACKTDEFTIGGVVSGLSGFGLRLQNNGSDTLKVSEDGAFTFRKAVPSGETYNVTVSSPPIFPLQDCEVENGSGTVVAAAITDITVTCERVNL